MTDNKKSDNQVASDAPTHSISRRTAVKTIVGGVSALAAYNVVPTRWSKPFVEQIFMPAHAGTSGAILNDPCSVSLESGTQASTSVVIQVTGFVTPPVSGLPTKIVATPSGAGSSVTVNTTTTAAGTFAALISIGNGPGITSVSVTTTVTGASGTATCSVPVPGSATTTPAPTTTIIFN